MYNRQVKMEEKVAGAILQLRKYMFMGSYVQKAGTTAAIFSKEILLHTYVS